MSSMQSRGGSPFVPEDYDAGPVVTISFNGIPYQSQLEYIHDHVRTESLSTLHTYTDVLIPNPALPVRHPSSVFPFPTFQFSGKDGVGYFWQDLSGACCFLHLLLCLIDKPAS